MSAAVLATMVGALRGAVAVDGWPFRAACIAYVAIGAFLLWRKWRVRPDDSR